VRRVSNGCALHSPPYPVSEHLYPQLLARTCIIHPPWFFYSLFNVFKVFISPRVLEKLGICPGRSAANPSASACPFASVRFALTALPSFLGGTCHCTALGGCIAGAPNSQAAPASPPGTAVTVPAGGCHEVVVTARSAKELLVYEWAIAEKGLEVSCSLQPEAGPPVSLLPARKYKAEEGKVAGTVEVPCAGVVTLRFDNSHSMFTKKTVTVSALMMPHPAPEGR